MSKSKQLVTVGIVTLMVGALAGCAHSHTRGSIAVKHGSQEADVCIGGKEISPGDRVTLFKNKCTGGGGEKGVKPSCQKIKLGEGQVVSVIDEHYSTIKVDSGVSFDAGTIVEKQ